MSKGPSKNEIKSATVDDVVLRSHLDKADASEFSFRMAAYTGKNGVKVPIELLDNNLCAPFRQERFDDAIYNYAKKKLAGGASDHYQFSRNDVGDIRRFAMATCKEVQEPLPFRFASEGTLSYVALPFDPLPGDCPNWDKLIGNLTNQQVVRAYIGSLFVRESYRQQYLWIYGKGGDGKGCIGRWLVNVFSSSAVSLGTVRPDDKWFNSSIAFARVVIFADIEKYSYPSSEHFKNLSGGDSISVEEKFKSAYSVKTNFKFLFLSNNLPRLSGDIADQRRAIISEAVRSGFTVEPGFEDRLWVESGAFIAKCLADYAELCPDHKEIPFKDESIEAWTQLKDEPYEEFFADCFVKTADGQGFVTASELNKAVEIRWPQATHGSHAFIMWLKSRNIKKVKMRVKGFPNPVWVYLGIVFSPDTSSLKYRPTRLIYGNEKRSAVPSAFEGHRLTLLKNEAQENIADEIFGSRPE